MASRYASPQVPIAPNTTPASVRTTLRAPIYNPYDKFTGEEFDAWIGDLTSKIRRVLAHDEPLVGHVKDVGDMSAYDDGPVEDSFAEVKARRAAKGKERADLEDSEEEEFVESIIISAEDEEQGDETQEKQEYDAEAYSDENAISARTEPPETIEISSDEDEDEGPVVYHSFSPVSDNEGDNSADEEGYLHRPDLLEDEDEAQPASNVAKEDFPPREARGRSGASPIEIPDPWAGPRNFSEDFYSGGDLPESALRTSDPNLLPTEEIDPLEDDFPLPSTSDQPVELADPWIGPRMYAEDFYSGGDIRGDPSVLTPSHLTPMSLTPRHDDDVGMSFISGGASPSPSAESPRSIYDVDVDELEETPEMEYYDMKSAERSEGIHEVPTFSMPPSKEGQDVEANHRPPVASISEEIVLENTLPDIVDEAGVASIPPASFHKRSASPSPTAASGHLDWNFPPAFRGRVASGVGHLHSPPVEDMPSVSVSQSGRPEVLEVSDDEEDNLSGNARNVALLVDLIGHHGSKLEGEIPIQPLAHEERSQDSIEHAMPDVPNSVSSREPEQYDYNEFESLYLAHEFHDLEQDTAVPEDIMHEEHLEPVCVQSADFGDLPTNTPHTLDTFSPESELVNVLGHFNKPDVSESYDMTADKIPSSRIPAGEVPAPVSVEVPAPVSVEVPAPVSVEVPAPVSVEVVADTNLVEEDSSEEVHSDEAEVRERTPSDDAIRIYEVLEVDSDEENEVDELEDAKEADVTTDYSDGPVLELEFVVEEAVTEGRRTVEPEGPLKEATVRTRDHSVELDVADDIQRAPTEDIAHSHVETIVSPPTPPDPPVAATESDSQNANRFNQGATLSLNETTENDLHSDMDEGQPLELSRSPSRRFRSLTPTSVPSPAHENPTATFSAGIPMPISADPSVPDPASMYSTPASPGSPTDMLDESASAFAGGDKRLSAASAIPPSLLKHLSGHKSISGLFTPLSEADSSPVESVHSSEQSDEEMAKGPPSHDGGDVPEGGVLGVSIASAPESVEHDIHLGATSEVLSSVSETTAERLSEELDVSAGRVKQTESDVGEADADGDIDSDYAPSDDIRSSREGSLQPKIEDSRKCITEHKVIIDVPSAKVEDVVPETSGEKLHDTTSEEKPLDASQSEFSIKESKLYLVREAGVGDSEEHPAQLPLATSSPAEPSDDEISSIIQGADQETKSVGFNETLETPDRMSPRQPTVEVDSSGASSPKVSNEPEGSRPLKRKRGDSTSVPPQMTRSQSSKSQNMTEQDSVKPSSKDKGKEKALDHASVEDDAVSLALTSLGDDTSTNLETISEYQEFSRSGSVASSEPRTADMESSPPTAPPATLTRQVTAIIHAHGFMHHHHARLQAQPAQPQSEDLASLPPAPGVDDEPKPSEEASSSTVPPMTSPVTRSNCRFHKISLPREEDGPRVFFVVPGCSLSNMDLMQQQEIEDHGPAQAEDQPRLIQDIESLDLSLYLLGVLRQLVGVDLLREQEIYYLTQPGEEPRFKSRQKVKHHPRDSISGRNSFAPQLSHKSARVRKGQAASNADSISASGSIARKHRPTRRSMSASVSASISDDDMDEGASKPKAKRRRANASVASRDTPPVGPSDLPDAQKISSSQPITQKPRVRRVKRLGVDAAAYKTEPSGDSDSDDDKMARGKRRRAVRNKKRTRGDDAAHTEGAREASAKKRKILDIKANDPEEHTESQ